MKSILAVDDDPASLALVQATLGADGCEVRTARTPEGALEILKTWTPDVILIDIQLRGLDNGLDFARRLKANIATRATPIIAFTAYADRESEAEARGAGCDAFLEKPISTTALTAAVRKAADRT
jgi:two-component system, cell cycle response regulator DivK